MSDIVQFLNERLAEDQAAAEYDQQQRDAGGEVRYSSGADFAPALGRLMLDARHDPARVLAEVAAKRELLTYAFKEAARRDAEWGCVHSAEDIRGGRCREEQPDGLFILRALAAPYAGHPDFDSKWRPE